MLSWHATRRSIEIAKPLVVTSVASDLILQSVAGRACLDAAAPLPCLGRPALRVASPPAERTSTNGPCTERPRRTPPLPGTRLASQPALARLAALRRLGDGVLLACYVPTFEATAVLPERCTLPWPLAAAERIPARLWSRCRRRHRHSGSLVLDSIGGLRSNATNAHSRIRAASTVALHADVALLAVARAPAVFHDVGVAGQANNQDPVVYVCAARAIEHPGFVGLEAALVGLDPKAFRFGQGLGLGSKSVGLDRD